MYRRLHQWLVATLVVVTALSSGPLGVATATPIGASPAVPGTGGQADDTPAAADTPTAATTTATPMGTSGNFPTETIAVALAVGGIVLAGAGALALRRRGGRDGTGTDGAENRRNR